MLDDLKEYAKVNHVPIINDDGLLFLKSILSLYDKPTILEIGTAIGYSAIYMAKREAIVYSIEKNEEMFSLAKKNVKKYGLVDRINLILADALTYDEKLPLFDVIFIDAAKAQYEKFFTKYQKFLKKEGIIVCDNLDFHNLDINSVKRQTKQLLRKIANFKDFLNNNKDFLTRLYHVGDGMSLSVRSENEAYYIHIQNKFDKTFK